MATRSYTIHSSYDVDDEEHELLVEDAEQKEIEESDGLLQAQRPLRPPKPAPRFVPAKHADGERIPLKSPSFVSASTTPNLSSLEWYRSIRSSATSTPTAQLNDSVEEGPVAGPSKPRGVIVQPTPLLPESSSSSAPRLPTIRPERKTKHNWFIMNAIESQPRTEPSTPAPNLDAMLARDPPPLPMEKKYQPPVWLEIGPSNKGFAMLQRTGWNEGEPLGPDVIRRPHSLPSPEVLSFGAQSSEPAVKRETREVQLGPVEDGVSELRQVEVIDLTEDDEAPVSRSPTPDIEDDRHVDQPMELDGLGDRTALVTPIATRLKLDRLGIGLKARTEGPHKASLKRVTHGHAALAAHIRAATEQKKRIKEVGRGRRGFQRRYQKEALERQNLLEQLR